MSLKLNANKIHSDLLLKFENVTVEEKSSLKIGSYLDFNVLHEGKKLNFIVAKQNLENDKFSWSYYSNPDKKDHLVERNSTVNGIIDDITDIFEKNRFDSDYIKSIQN